MNRLAKAATSLSGKTRSREKMKLDEVLIRYPEGVTLNWIDLRTSDDDVDYCVFTFEEEPERFSSGAGDFMKLWEAWTAEFGGSISDMQEYLAANPLRIKIWKQKTKSKKTYTCVSVVQDGRANVERDD